MVKISIHGSCVSKDMFGYDLKNEFQVVNYIARNSIISLSCPPVAIPSFEKITDCKQLKWEERMIYFDSRKMALDRIMSISCEYLIIDLIDERFDIVESNGGCLTYSQVLQRSEHMNELIPYAVKKVEENTQEFYAAYERYAASLRENFDARKIIIHEAYPVLTYRGGG